MNYKRAEIYYGKKSGTGKDIKKPWYVYYSFINPSTGKYERFIDKGGINRVHSIKERTEEGNKLKSAINKMLDDGYDPFSTIHGNFTFNEAMEYALDKKKVNRAKKTWQGYKSVLDNVKIIAVAPNLHDTDIKEIRRANIKAILYQVMAKKSVHRYNFYLVVLKSLFKVLLIDEKIEVSPVHGIPAEPEDETEGYALLDDDRELIKELVYKDSYQFGVYCETLHATGIRPNELLGIQWRRLNFEKLEIVVTPRVETASGSEKIAKSRKIRHVPVKASLLDKYKLLHSISCHISGQVHPPEDWFIFSDPKTLLSGPKKMHQNRMSERWSSVVHGGGIDVSKKMYALKHLGADDKIMAGIPLEAVKELFGHHSVSVTKRYTKKLRQKNAEILRRDSPEF